MKRFLRTENLRNVCLQNKGTPSVYPVSCSIFTFDTATTVTLNTITSKKHGKYPVISSNYKNETIFNIKPD